MNSELIQAIIDDCVDLIPEDYDFSFLKGKRVAVLGSTGLIGFHLCCYLVAISTVKNLEFSLILCGRSTQKLELLANVAKENNAPLKIGICSFDLLEGLPLPKGVDFIVNAASPANPTMYSLNPVETAKANVLGTLNCLEYAKENGSKVIFVSSGEVYGEQTPSTPQGYLEDQPGVCQSMRSRSCYTEAKRFCETLCASYADEYGVNTCVARMCFVYGPAFTEADNRASTSFIKDVAAGRNIVMTSKGLQVRSYLYAGDAAFGLVVLMRDGVKGEAYNVASLDSISSIADYAKTLVEVANEDREDKLSTVFKEADQTTSKGYSTFQQAVQNPQKLYDLGFKPATNLKEGLEKTLSILKKASN